MTNRELFHATMLGENGDKLLHVEQGFNVPYKKWYKQGMPSHVQSARAELSEWENLHDHFNVTGFLGAPWIGVINEFCYPTYEGRLVSDDGSRVTYITGLGNTLRMYTQSEREKRDDGTTVGGLFNEIAFAVTCRKDYESTRELYIGNHAERYDVAWAKENASACMEQTDFLLTHFVTGPFAYLRSILGTETAIAAPYEDPEWVQMMLRDHLETCIGTYAELFKYIRHDISYVWEDCCGKTGPFMSPHIFDETFAWWYREWKDYTKSMGIPWTVLDTDGDPSPLVVQWYENGIDCMLPWEVNGVDMLKFAEQYPKYKMIGGIYKHMFEPASPGQVGRFTTNDVYEAIDIELKRVVEPMRKRGGYFPMLDHGAQGAVDYQGYKHYSERLYEYGKANTINRTFRQQ